MVLKEFGETINEIAEFFKENNLSWSTSTFEGIPTREMVRDDIIEKLQKLHNGRNVLRYLSSGRIIVIKTVDSGSDGDFVEYDIAIDKNTFTEDELLLHGLIKDKSQQE